jgi:MGT family glycosyltransferase
VNRKDGVYWTPEPVLEFSKLLDSFMAYGFEEKGNFWHTEKLNLYFIPKAFQHNGELFDERFCFVGSCLNRPFRRTWKNRSKGRPIIIVSDVSGSSDASYFKSVVDALSGSEYHVILSLGEIMSENSLGSLPENFEINRGAYHLEMLPYASLTICAGGLGTTMESIYHGVPVVALPPSPFQKEVAYRIAELGVGIHLPRHQVSIDMIRGAVITALRDDSLLENVRNMQRIVRTSGGEQMAVESIENYLI